jgi:predicted  nucleic acid-binding Zn-ribbon protein
MTTEYDLIRVHPDVAAQNRRNLEANGKRYSCSAEGCEEEATHFFRDYPLGREEPGVTSIAKSVCGACAGDLSEELDVEAREGRA